MNTVDQYNVGDNLLSVSLPLPDGATTVISSGMDLGAPSVLATFNGENELLISAPALSTSQLPDAETIAYSVVMGANADITAPTVVLPNVLIQTGAGGVGAAAASVRVRLPAEMLQFIGLQAVKSGSGDASGAITTMQMFF